MKVEEGLDESRHQNGRKMDGSSQGDEKRKNYWMIICDKMDLKNG